MDQDLLIVGAMFILIFAIPAIYSAIIDRHFPLFSLIFAGIAGFMIYYSLRDDPDGLQFHDIPMAVVSVIAKYIL